MEWSAGQTDVVGGGAGGGGAAAAGGAGASPSDHSDAGNEGNALDVAPQSETSGISNAAAEADAEANDAGGLLKAESNAEVAALSPQPEFVDDGTCQDMSDDDAAVDDDGDDGGDDDETRLV